MLIERHFFFKGLQEINKLLTKNNEGFLLDFSGYFYQIFEHQLTYYTYTRGFYGDNGLLKRDLANKHLNCLKQVIIQHTNDEEFVLHNEKLKLIYP